MTTTAEPTNTNIFDKAIIISLGLSRPGNRRKISTGAVEVEADKSMIHVSKDLLDSKELKDVTRLDGEIRNYLRNLALPSPLGDGKYLLPIPLVERVDERLSKFLVERQDLVRTFMAVYPDKVEEARGRLNGLFNPTDYPEPEVLVGAFQMIWSYLTFGVPAQLETISRALFERETEKAKARVTEATDEIVQLLRLTVKELTDHMVDRLTPGPDGKAKIFRNSLITNMTEFLDVFDLRNITDDQDLAVLVAKMRGLLQGVDPDTLRNNDAVRTYVLKGIKDTKAAIDTLVVTKPRRLIVVDGAAA